MPDECFLSISSPDFEHMWAAEWKRKPDCSTVILSMIENLLHKHTSAQRVLHRVFHDFWAFRLSRSLCAARVWCKAKRRKLSARNDKNENIYEPIGREFQIEDSSVVVVWARVWSDAGVQAGVDPGVVSSSWFSRAENLAIPQPAQSHSEFVINCGELVNTFYRLLLIDSSRVCECR